MTTQRDGTYSAEELRAVALQAAGLGAAAVMRLAPQVVMPAEDILHGVEELLADARDGVLAK